MKSLVPWRKKQDVELWDDNWFERAWESPFKTMLSPFSGALASVKSSVDVIDGEKEVTVRVEIPGMDEKEINLTWQDGVLRIRGEKKNEKKEQKKNYFYRECNYGYFSRDIPLGNNIDWKDTKAKYKNGVITVKLPKKETNHKVIDIKVN